MRGRIGGWIRRRTLAEGLALLAGTAVFGYVGWDSALWDARFQLLLHLLAIGAIAALVVHGLRGGEMPRTRVDLPMLALVAAFALATILAVNLGMSLRAMAAIIATALMLPVALVALRLRPGWVALVVCLPVLGLAAGALGAMAARRLGWVLAGAPGLPPIRLPAEGTPFGSVAVPPFILLGAWAVAGAIEDVPVRRAVRTCLVALGIPLGILSGSRSAWLAIGVTALVLAAPWLWARRGRILRPGRISARGIGLGAVAVVAAVGLLVVIAPRLTALTSLIYRGQLWRDTINAWSSSPVTGLGPGIMPYARQAAAPDLSFPVSQPHSHNLALGILGDAGLIGLAAGVALVVALLIVAGPWRSRSSAGRAASAALIGIGVSGLFEDLTFLPNFNLVLALMLAIALADAGAVSWSRLRRPRPPVILAAAAAALVLVATMVTADAGAIAYRAGADAAQERDWPAAVRGFERAVEIDPWHPTGPDALGVALVSAGDPVAARSALDAATALNSGNGRAWANLAVVCGTLHDAGCQLRAAREAVASAKAQDQTLINAALALEALGHSDEADAAYRRSLLTHPQTSFAVDWPRTVEIGDGTVDLATGRAPDLNILLAKLAMNEPVDPTEFASDAVRALAHAALGEEAAARDAIARARREVPDSTLTWEVDLVLARAWGEPTDHARRIYALLGTPVNAPDAPIEIPGVRFDIGSFRMVPRDGFVESAEDLRVQPLYPWLLGQILPGGASAR